MQLPTIAELPERARLLFVEGDAAQRESIAALLSEYFEVTAAADGESALALLAGHRFDVLCADDDGPGLTGRELLARAAVLPQAPRGVLVTAQIDEPTVVGSVGFQVVFKPYDPQQLIDTVHREYTLARMRRLVPG
ncbi:MAG TPA: response regulator [Myxococcales bacterium]|jgi:CheY-like chemotaxis protein|nr:response regulator [Myxococcales bacterium]